MATEAERDNRLEVRASCRRLVQRTPVNVVHCSRVLACCACLPFDLTSDPIHSFIQRRYDELIREQEAHSERIRRQAIPSPPPDCIGITANPDDAKSQQGNVTDAAAVDVLGVPPGPSFWDQHRQQVAELTRAQRLTPDSQAAVTRRSAQVPAVVQDRGTQVTNRNRMILRSGREYRIA
jgi:hypothetical protein